MSKLLRNRITIPWTPFYRRYPYRNGVSINSADDRGLVDFGLGVFCNRIPKSANSSVVANLAYQKYGERMLDREAKKRFMTPSQLSKAQLEQLPSLFKFAIVRNPYTRVLSAFLDKIERGAQKRNKPVSFLEFLEYLEGGGLYSNAHWAPQTSLMLLPFDGFDFFGKTENLEQDLTFVLGKLNCHDESPEILPAMRQTMGASSKLHTYYDKTTQQKVDNLYAGDFQAFDYPMTLPNRNSNQASPVTADTQTTGSKS